MMFLVTLTLWISSVHVDGYQIGLLLAKFDSMGDNAHLQELATYAVDRINNITGLDHSLILEEYDSTLMGLVEACCSLVEQGVYAIVSTDTSSNTALQADVLAPLNIPLLTASATNPFLISTDRPNLLQLSPSDDYQSTVIFDILRNYEWYEFSIMASSDSYGMKGLLKLQALVATDTHFVLQNVFYFEQVADLENFDVTDTLLLVKNSLSKVIVLNCHATHGRMLLDTANEMGMMDVGFVWIVTDGLTGLPELLLYDGVYMSFYEGLIGTVPSMPSNNLKYKAFRDSFLRNSSLAIQDLTIYTLLMYDAVCMVIEALETLPDLASPELNCSSKTGWDGGSEVLETLKNISYSGVTGVLNFTKSGESRRISYDIVNFKEDGFQKVGEWWNSTNLRIINQVTFLGGGEDAPPGVSNSLAGQHLKLGVKEEGPFNYKATEDCEGNACWTGFCPDMVTKLSEHLDFTYEYMEPLDGQFGGYNKTSKTWNGLVRDLIDKRTDMVTINFSTNTARKEVIDFSYPFMDAGLSAVVKGNSDTSNVFFFLSPFQFSVWMLIILMNFVVTGLVCLFSKLSPYGKYGGKMHAMQTCSCEACVVRRGKKRREMCTFNETNKFECLVQEIEHEDRLRDLSFYNSVWVVGTGLVCQSSDTLPHCIPGRVLLFSWWLFVMVLVSMYTANLTAFLTLNNLGVSLKSLEDLLVQNDYEWGMIGSRNPETLMLGHINPNYIKIVEQGVTLTSLTEGLERVRAGKFVFIDEGPVLTYTLVSDCDVFTVGNDFQSFEYAFGLPKNAPYASLINMYILKYREAGYLDELWDKWSSGDNQCSSNVGSDATLGLNTVAGIFCLLAIGIGISAFFVVIELAYVSIVDSYRQPHTSCWSALKVRLMLKWDSIVGECHSTEFAKVERESSRKRKENTIHINNNQINLKL